jgi:hypothetical protein
MYFSVVRLARSAGKVETLTGQVLVGVVLFGSSGLQPEAAAKNDFVAHGRGNDCPAFVVLIIDAPAFAVVGAKPMLPNGSGICCAGMGQRSTHHVVREKRNTIEEMRHAFEIRVRKFRVVGRRVVQIGWEGEVGGCSFPVLAFVPPCTDWSLRYNVSLMHSTIENEFNAYRRRREQRCW